MTQKFIRWNCPNCQTHNMTPASEGPGPEPLRCDYCQYVHDPLDDTWPRPEGWAEDANAPTLRMTRRAAPRQTPS